MLIQLKKVDKIYRDGTVSFQALREVDLSVEEGEMVAVQGRSGAGKSTLLHIIGCVDTFDGGSYLLDGTDIGGLRDGQLSRIRSRTMGFIMQDFALVSKLSVFDNIAVPLYLAGTGMKKIRSAVKAAAAEVGLEGQLDKKAGQLSGGQKQRVAIARAIVNAPRIILADEPTGALDATTAGENIALLKGQKEKGITILIVTHDNSVAAACQRVIEIRDGRIV